jgi:tripartite-type tricarboxylate transporter receptor subunit TctC
MKALLGIALALGALAANAQTWPTRPVKVLVGQPAGTPGAIVQRVNRDFDAVMKEPDTAKKLSDLGPVLEGAGTPESLAQFLKDEDARWARLVKAINFQPE